MILRYNFLVIGYNSTFVQIILLGFYLLDPLETIKETIVELRTVLSGNIKERTIQSKMPSKPDAKMKIGLSF